MKTCLSKASLSPQRRRLVELLQRINFGRIEGLLVEAGEPVLDPLPDVRYEYKFGGDNGPRPELGRPDFALKAQLVELFEHLDRIVEGGIDVLEVKHGLPFRMIVSESGA